MEVHKLGWSRTLAKKIFPTIGPAFSPRPAQLALYLLETSVAILQGKGAGTGWDAGAETKVALPFLSPGAVVFDVGANMGTWTTEIRHAYKQPLKIYMFEPQPSCQRELAPLAADGCVLVSSAVGNEKGTVTFHFSIEGAGSASIYQRKESYFADQVGSIEVPILKLDDFAAENSISKIDYMKIDVEGHELAVLKGASDLISRGAVRAIAFEFGSANIYSGTFFRSFWDFLTGYGYSLSRITPGGRLSKIESYYEDLEYFRGVSNYLAVLR